MSETKAAVAERAIQSLKHIIYRYIEDPGEKIDHKLAQFASPLKNCVNRPIEKSPKDVKKTDFLSILNLKPLTKYTKTKLEVEIRKGYNILIKVLSRILLLIS